MSYTDQQISETVDQLAAAGAPPEKIRRFVESAKAAQGVNGAPPVATSSEDKQALAMDRMANAGIPFGMQMGVGPIAGESTQIASAVRGGMVDTGLEAGGATAGQALGSAAGPYAVAAVPVLGALGAAGGNTLAQFRRMGLGQQDKFNFGQLGGAAVGGMIPGVSQGKGLAQFAKAAGTYGAGNLAAKATETGINEGRLPTVGEGSLAMAGGALGAGAQKVLGSTTRAQPNAEQAMNAVRDSRFRDLQPQGVVVPPMELGVGSEMASSIAGKAALGQQSSKMNQSAWQRMAREDLGLDGALPFHEGDVVSGVQSTFDKVRQKAYVPYEELAAISPKVGRDLDLLRQQNKSVQDAYHAFKAAKISREDYERVRNTRDAIESAIETQAQKVGRDDLVPRMLESKKRIAQSYAIQNATNQGNGFVDPSALAMQLDAGVPLTDNIKRIALFQMAFPRAAVESGRVPAPGVDALRQSLSVAQASQGTPTGMLGAFANSMGKPMRNHLLSPGAQKRYAAFPEQTDESITSALARFAAQTQSR